jgi:hypothetical protein
LKPESAAGALFKIRTSCAYYTHTIGTSQAQTSAGIRKVDGGESPPLAYIAEFRGKLAT